MDCINASQILIPTWPIVCSEGEVQMSDNRIIIGGIRHTCFPPKSVLRHYGSIDCHDVNPRSDSQVGILEKCFKKYGIDVWIEEIKQGPTFRQYRFGFDQGSFNSRILKKNREIAQNLLVSDVRIVPPGSGNTLILVEVSIKKRSTVGFDSMVGTLETSIARIPMALGIDVDGVPVVIDVSKMHHLLILGDEGSGKTMCIHSLINSILYSRTPDKVQFYMADCNFQGHSVYNGIPHLLAQVITEPQAVLDKMEELCNEMERRMTLFKESGKSCISSFNEFMEHKGETKSMLSYIVFIMDEYEPIITGFRSRFEYWIKRITTVARFCGIHFVLSTKYVNRDTVSQVINLNIPSRLYSRIQNVGTGKSRIVDPDASKLELRGDFIYPGTPTSGGSRIQGTYINSEISSIVEWVRNKNKELRVCF